MKCILDSGYMIDCKTTIGGIQEVYIGNFNKNQTYTLDTDDSIIGVTGSGTASYYTMEQNPETAQYAEELPISLENNTDFCTQTLTLSFYLNDSTLRNLLLVLLKSRMSVIVKDNEGKYWLMGINHGVRMTAGPRNFGKAMGDTNGATVTLQAKERYYANEIKNIELFNIV